MADGEVEDDELVVRCLAGDCTAIAEASLATSNAKESWCLAATTAAAFARTSAWTSASEYADLAVAVLFEPFHSSSLPVGKAVVEERVMLGCVAGDMAVTALASFSSICASDKPGRLHPDVVASRAAASACSNSISAFSAATVAALLGTPLSCSAGLATTTTASGAEATGCINGALPDTVVMVVRLDPSISSA
jgi:hypothetical protein